MSGGASNGTRNVTDQAQTTNAAIETPAEGLTAEQLAQVDGGTARNGNLQITQLSSVAVSGRVTSIAVDP